MEAERKIGKLIDESTNRGVGVRRPENERKFRFLKKSSHNFSQNFTSPE